MRSRLHLPVLIVTVAAACTGDVPTNPERVSDPLLAKGVVEYASLSGGIEAAPFAVENSSRDPNRLAIRAPDGYLAAINLQATYESATAACKTVGDATVALALKPLLFSPADARTRFFFDVDLLALGTANAFHEVQVFWDDPANKRQLYLTIGQTNPSDASFPNQFPTVSRTGSVYSLTGGIVTLRTNYGKPVRNASLVCPNLDAVHMTYPAP